MVDVLAGTDRRAAGDRHHRRPDRLGVGAGGARPTPAGAKRIDLPGKTLLPGLIDMHVHLDLACRVRRLSLASHITDSFWPAVGVANAKKTLEAGFTTVRNVGSDRLRRRRPAQAIDGGWMQGPRIVTATYAIGATGGHCDDNMLPALL